MITLRRVLSSPHEKATVWSSRGTRYRLEEWDKSGQLLTAIDREVEWFEPWTQPPARNAREQPPPSTAIDIEEDREGRLWSLVSVADEDWLPLPPGGGTSDGLTFTTMEQRNRLHDTMIEVIDPGSGRLLASARIDEHLLGFAGRGIVYSYIEDELGQRPRFVLQRLAFVSNEQGGTR